MSFFIFLPGVNFTAGFAGMTIGTAAFLGLQRGSYLFQRSQKPQSREIPNDHLEPGNLSSHLRTIRMTLRTSLGWSPRPWKFSELIPFW